MRFKTRRGTLEEKLAPYVDANNMSYILGCMDAYERVNLETIKKLKKGKTIDTKRIDGAIKQTINAHGPITKQYVSSATKRIYGALLDEPKKPRVLKRQDKQEIIFACIVLAVIAMVVFFTI